MVLRRYGLVVGRLVLASGCVISRPQPVPVPETVRMRVSGAWGCPADTACAEPQRALEYQGTLIVPKDETLVLHDERQHARVAVALAEVTRLEIYRGHKGSARAAAKGSGLGALLGTGLGAVVGAASAGVAGEIFDGETDLGAPAAEGAVTGATAGAIAGAVHGATVGSAVWQEITVHDLRQELCQCRLPLPEISRP